MLEQEIGGALADADVNSNDLLALIERTESAIVEADQAAETARCKAFDPGLSPNPMTARAAMEDAIFVRDRLKTLLPRLQACRQEVQGQEYLAQWHSSYEVLKAKRDALAEELRAVYPEFETKITDLLTRIADNNEELSRLHQARPGGVAQHLLGAELVARDLERFTISVPSIAQELKLPTFAPGQRLAWPSPQPPLAAVCAAMMTPPYDPRYSADWAAAVKEDNVRRAANEAKWAEEERARQEESRQAYEASLQR